MDRWWWGSCYIQPLYHSMFSSQWIWSNHPCIIWTFWVLYIPLPLKHINTLRTCYYHTMNPIKFLPLLIIWYSAGESMHVYKENVAVFGDIIVCEELQSEEGGLNSWYYNSLIRWLLKQIWRLEAWRGCESDCGLQWSDLNLSNFQQLQIEVYLRMGCWRGRRRKEP